MRIARSFSLCGAVVMATLVASAEHGMVDSSPTILSVETASNPTNTLMIDFDVTTSKPASVTVTYFDPLEPEFVVSKPTDLNTTHHFTIVRLKADTEYHYKIVAVDESGDKSPPKNGKFVTGLLPPGLTSPIARIELVRGVGTTYPTLFDFNHFDPPFVGQTTTPFNGHVVLDS